MSSHPNKIEGVMADWQIEAITPVQFQGQCPYCLGHVTECLSSQTGVMLLYDLTYLRIRRSGWQYQMPDS